MKFMPKTKRNVDPQRSKAAALMGAVGGASGTGKAKKRDPAHYRVTLAEARRAALTRKKLGK